MKKKTIGIIGLGNFGKCWVKWLSTGFKVESFDPQSKFSTCKTAQELFQKSDAVFFCVPINKTQKALKDTAKFMKPGQLIADVCSVKIAPAKWLKKEVPKHCEIIATHPMFGPISAANELKGLNFMYYPLRAKLESYKWLLDFLTKHQVNLTKMTPDKHDKLAANTQALSFFIGQSLGTMKLKATSIDTTQFKILHNFSDQICSDTPELFHDMMRYNPYAKPTLKKFLVNAKKMFEKL